MIAFLINELDIRGGTHKQFLKLLEYTAAQTNDFYIVTKKLNFDKTYPGFRQFEDKIRLLNTDYPKSWLRRLLTRSSRSRAIIPFIKDAECINIHDGGFESYLQKMVDKKVVWQINDLNPCFKVGASKNFKTDWKSKLRKALIIRASKNVDIFTVNVTKNKERVFDAFKREAKVLYCGIEPIDIGRSNNETLERFKQKKINLLSSGVFFPYRNYETQIEVVKKLSSKGFDVHLNIIGSTELDKEYSSKIKTLIKSNNLEDKITICGQVNEEDFKSLHKNADIFIFINIDQSWGLAVFEAMSCGLPVIVSNSVGATEILKDDENAIFVNPIDVKDIVNRIEALMNNQSLYNQLSNASRDFHKDYTWEKAYCEPMYNLLIE